MNDREALVRLGGYFLQGLVASPGWGPKSVANRYTMEKALKVAEDLRKKGFRCRAVWDQMPTRKKKT